MRILNFHDLGEDGRNACYKELLKYWSEDQIVSRTYDLAAKDPAGILLDSMVYGPYDLIVGTGFGGVLALLAGRATGIRTVLVNPMYPIRRYLPTELPDYEYGETLASYEFGKIMWHPDGAALQRNVFLILGRDDDVTDTARTPAYFREGNSRFVAGGHSPSGEEFAQAFGELTGGLEALDEGHPDSKEGPALAYLRKYFRGQGPRMLYIYGEEQRLMTEGAKRLIGKMRAERPELRCLYISADELPESQEGLRGEYRDIDLLVVDNNRKSLLTEAAKRSLWVACDEVVGHGGKVLLISDETATHVFGDDGDIMELIWSGRIEECELSCIGENRKIRDGEVCIVMSGDNPWDRKPFSETLRHMRVDEVDARDGHIAIHWSLPDEEPKHHTLYLYYDGEKWVRDEEDGYCYDKDSASIVLEKASAKIIAQTEEANHRLEY